MLRFRKRSKYSAGFILLYFLSIALFVSGCLSVFEWNDFEYDWTRSGSSMTVTVVGDLHAKGSPDSTNWQGTRHAWEAFQFPDAWSQDSLVSTAYQIYKVTPSGDSLMRTGTLTWHHSQRVAQRAEAKTPAEKGNTYRGFESNQSIPWDSISSYVGPGKEYRIHFTSVLTISNATDLGIIRCGQILGDEIDDVWSGRSFMVDGDVPTINQWGVIVLVGLVIASGVFIMLRRRKATVPA